MDEFERRMHFTGFVTTLADTISKMNPLSLMGEDGRTVVEGAGLKDQYASAVKTWLDMYLTYAKKATSLGEKYPLEELLGIRTDAPQTPLSK